MDKKSESINFQDRGGKHDYFYGNEQNIEPTNGLTPSQTVGPFFAYGLTPSAYEYPLEEIHTASVKSKKLAGTEITLEGQVFDAEGKSIHDALIEIIQADANGEYITEPRNNGFTGYFRTGTGAQGSEESGGDTRFIFETIKPSKTAINSAPFVTLIITMRGVLNHYITRAYFEGDDYSQDEVMQQVPENRRQTLIAKELSKNHFRFDIHMQGENETVFFDI